MKSIVLMVIFFLGTISSQSQSLICIQSGNNPPVFETDIDKAISKAKSGDYIYLPGGMFTANNLSINKKLYIIGAGYHPDSSKATSTTEISGISFYQGSDGSVLTGVSSAGTIIIQDSNITITRCKAPNIIMNTYSSSNVRITENILLAIDCNYSTSNILISKNIIYYHVKNINLPFVLSNNIFLAHGSGQYPLVAISNGRLENNIFYQNLSSQVVYVGISNVFQNNLFSADSTAINSNTSYSNIFNEPQANIFLNFNGNSQWEKAHNFHLKTTCSGINAGTDGTHIGLYGTNLPFKDGGIPFNPHFVKVAIPGATNSNGLLPISITIEGQDY